MQIVIDIPEGLKIDFENENWTALSCMEMKNALMNGVPLPKGHGRLIDESTITEVYARKTGWKDVNGIKVYPRIEIIGTNAPTIIEADRSDEE